ncbi:MAG: caspase family protein, partial [Blastocatellia bacterium]
MKRKPTCKIALTVVSLLLCCGAPDDGGARQKQPKRTKGRALLVGVNQYAQPDVKPTSGAEEDARETAEFIKQRYGFEENEIKLLLGKEATAEAIIAWFQRWLIEDTAPGDRVFFLYAGHGSHLPDDDGDEADGEDEALAPYDATLTGENFILDDKIGQLIAQLSGRVAALVFDSCHSGTISRGKGGAKPARGGDARYLPSPKEARQLGLSTRSRGGGVVDYEVRDARSDPRILRKRDLNLVDEKDADKTTGIVIISAAQSGQTAYSMDVDGKGKQRGALSHAFAEAHRDGNPPLKELREAIGVQIKKFQSEKQLKGVQVPQFEIISKFPRDDLPLFAGARMRLEAFANPGSSIKISLRSREGKAAYRLGADISYEVTASSPGWLYLIVFSQENVATCVFPNNTNVDDRNNRVEAGAHRIPRSQYLQAQEPIGQDVVIALLS